MGKISAFEFMTLNGFIKGPGEDISWHPHSEEENEHAAGSLQSGNILLFGRVTYEMMVSFWPTPTAYENFPAVAEGMNKAEKIVFSRTLNKAEWNNTRLIREDIIAEMKKLKRESPKDMTLLGSASILTQFAENGLIDEYQIMLDPVALGDGTSLFKGIKEKLHLELSGVKPFKNGIVVLNYRPR
jgi:dihydrofolate reductase